MGVEFSAVKSDMKRYLLMVAVVGSAQKWSPACTQNQGSISAVSSHVAKVFFIRCIYRAVKPLSSTYLQQVRYQTIA